MKSKIIRKEITALIENIKKHSDRLDDLPTIPLLELNVILAKINKLHELTVVLKFLVAESQDLEIPEFIDPQYIDKHTALHKNVKKDTVKEEALEEDEEIYVEMEVYEDELDLAADADDLLASDDLVEVEPEEEENVDLLASDNLIEDGPEKQESLDELDQKFEGEIPVKLEKELNQLGDLPDLNEKYAGNKDNSLGNQLKQQPIVNLLSAIGINERYLYANELFDGDVEIFKDELNKVNEFNELEEAKSYLKDVLAPKYSWDARNEFVLALGGLVERRFQK